MFYKFVLLALALCTLVVAHPVQQQGTAVNVKLARRNNLTTPDGIFDSEKATMLRNSAKSKHEQNVVNRKANAQRKPPIAEVKISSRDRLPVHARQLPTEPLIDQGVLYEGYVWIGGPTIQQFIVQVDTGSSDLWIPSVDCASPACNGRSEYDLSRSSSGQEVGRNLSIGFAGGLQVSGRLVSDTVVIAGVRSSDQIFLAADQMSDGLPHGPDGVLGLGYPLASTSGRLPWLVQAFQQGSLSRAQFAMKLAANDSVLTLGGTDPSKFVEPVEFHPVNTTSGMWELNNATVSVGQTEVVFNAVTWIDSGTTVIYGPSLDVNALYSQIPGSQSLGNGKFGFPCSSVPTVAFNWAGTTKWTISPEIFNLGKVSVNSSTCVGAIVAMDMDVDGQSVWLLGDSFMKNVYSVFDMETNAIGFAALR